MGFHKRIQRYHKRYLHFFASIGRNTECLICGKNIKSNISYSKVYDIKTKDKIDICHRCHSQFIISFTYEPLRKNNIFRYIIMRYYRFKLHKFLRVFDDYKRKGKNIPSKTLYNLICRVDYFTSKIEMLGYNPLYLPYKIYYAPDKKSYILKNKPYCNKKFFIWYRKTIGYNP